MNSNDTDALIQLYERRFAELGRDVRTLGWGSEHDQLLRFKVLCEIGDLSGASICDIGCGFGDLVDYLQEHFGDFSYTGIDISPSLVQKARELRPDREFLCVNMLEAPFRKFDYLLLSGALNFRMQDNEHVTQTMLRKMFESANKGVAVNFLTSYVNFQRPHNYHHNPESVFSYARTLTPWVTLRHDYPLWEFSMYLYKNAPLSRSGGNAGPDPSA